MTASVFCYAAADDEAGDGLLSALGRRLDLRAAVYLGRPLDAVLGLRPDVSTDATEQALLGAPIAVLLMSPSLLGSALGAAVAAVYVRAGAAGHPSVKRLAPILWRDEAASHGRAAATLRAIESVAPRSLWLDWTAHADKRVLDGPLEEEIDRLGRRVAAATRKAGGASEATPHPRALASFATLAEIPEPPPPQPRARSVAPASPSRAPISAALERGGAGGVLQESAGSAAAQTGEAPSSGVELVVAPASRAPAETPAPSSPVADAPLGVVFEASAVADAADADDVEAAHGSRSAKALRAAIDAVLTQPDLATPVARAESAEGATAEPPGDRAASEEPKTATAQIALTGEAAPTTRALERRRAAALRSDAAAAVEAVARSARLGVAAPKEVRDGETFEVAVRVSIPLARIKYAVAHGVAALVELRMKDPDRGFSLRSRASEARWLLEGVGEENDDAVFEWRYAAAPTKLGRYPLIAAMRVKAAGDTPDAIGPDRLTEIRVEPDREAVIKRWATRGVLAACLIALGAIAPTLIGGVGALLGF